MFSLPCQTSFSRKGHKVAAGTSWRNGWRREERLNKVACWKRLGPCGCRNENMKTHWCGPVASTMLGTHFGAFIFTRLRLCCIAKVSAMSPRSVKRNAPFCLGAVTPPRNDREETLGDRFGGLWTGKPGGGGRLVLFAGTQGRGPQAIGGNGGSRRGNSRNGGGRGGGRRGRGGQDASSQGLTFTGSNGVFCPQSRPQPKRIVAISSVIAIPSAPQREYLNDNVSRRPQPPEAQEYF